MLAAEGLTDVVGVAGHSLGEFAALVAADAVALSDALELVLIRGAAMQRAGEERPGAMTALLGVGADDAEALCAEVRGDDVLVVANRNSPAQSVVSGSDRRDRAAGGGREGAQDPGRASAGRGRLPLGAHAPGRASPSWTCSERIEIRDPAIPIAENVTGELVTEAARLRELVGRQVVSPVYWETGIRNLDGRGRHHVPGGRAGRGAHEADETDRPRARRDRDLRPRGGPERPQPLSPGIPISSGP